MGVAKEQAYETIRQLVERFREQRDEYHRSGYNEHQARGVERSPLSRG